MKISFYCKNFCLLFLLIAPLTTFAQVPVMQKKDSLKMDSILQDFKRKESIRLDLYAKDTIKSTLFKSPILTIYSTSQIAGINGKQLQLQAIRFRHTHYIKLLLTASFVGPVQVDEKETLQLFFDDNTNISLPVIGKFIVHSSAMRLKSDLSPEYMVRKIELLSLLNKTVTSITLNYTGGSINLDIDENGAANIKNALLSVN